MLATQARCAIAETAKAAPINLPTANTTIATFLCKPSPLQKLVMLVPGLGHDVVGHRRPPEL